MCERGVQERWHVSRIRWVIANFRRRWPNANRQTQRHLKCPKWPRQPNPIRVVFHDGRIRTRTFLKLRLAPIISRRSLVVPDFAIVVPLEGFVRTTWRAVLPTSPVPAVQKEEDYAWRPESAVWKFAGQVLEATGATQQGHRHGQRPVKEVMFCIVNVLIQFPEQIKFWLTTVSLWKRSQNTRSVTSTMELIHGAVLVGDWNVIIQNTNETERTKMLGWIFKIPQIAGNYQNFLLQLTKNSVEFRLHLDSPLFLCTFCFICRGWSWKVISSGFTWGRSALTKSIDTLKDLNFTV